MIPPDTREALERYRDNHLPTGGFLSAVLRNDLFDAFNRADERNFAALGDIICWVENNLPVGSYGSPEAVTEWTKVRIVT